MLKHAGCKSAIFGGGYLYESAGYLLCSAGDVYEKLSNETPGGVKRSTRKPQRGRVRDGGAIPPASTGKPKKGERHG